jgi:hypothetical protein
VEFGARRLCAPPTIALAQSKAPESRASVRLRSEREAAFSALIATRPTTSLRIFAFIVHRPILDPAEAAEGPLQ